MQAAIQDCSQQYQHLCVTLTLASVCYLFPELADLSIRFEFPQFLLTICFCYLEEKEKDSLFQVSQSHSSVHFCLCR